MDNSWKYPPVVIEDALAIDDEKSICIQAKEYFSRLALKVNAGELYEFKVDKNDKWIDLCIPSNAKGFRNCLFSKHKLRVPKVPCFYLCGTIEMDDTNNFPIGLGRKFEIPVSGKIHFFANDKKDSRFANINNWGCIQLKIRRLA